MKPHVIGLRAVLVAALATIVTLKGGGAQELIDPASITATAGSVFGPDDPRFIALNTLDGVTDEGNRDTHMGNHWLALEGTLSETITFDLGRSYTLSNLEILNTSNTNWNDSETDTFTIAYSTDGTNFSEPSDPIALQDYDLGFQEVIVSATASHVQLVVTNSGDIDGNHLGEDPPNAEARVGLNEVRFFELPGDDTDDDGMVDEWEIENFGDLSRDGTEDEDVPAPDGLTNLREHNLRTNPLDADSDDDDLTDGAEVDTHQTDPLDPDTDMDTLEDGDEINVHMSDPTLVDTDGDTLSDPDEVNVHMTRPDLVDTDGDSLNDDLEINELGTDPLVPNEDPRGTQVDPATIMAVAGSTFNDSGLFDASNLLDDLTDEGNRDTHRGTHWIALEGTFTETVTFDLGDSYSLTGLEILNTSNTNWNDSETDTFTVATSSDGGNNYTEPSAPIELQDFSLGFQSVPVQAAGTTHVRLVVTNDQTVDGDPAPGAEARVGLNEVRFFTGPGTPFVITSIKLTEEEIDGGTQPIAEIVFNSDPGATYAVDFGFDMKVWFEADDSVDSDGKTTTYTDRDQAVLGRPRVYYRVRSIP